MMPKRVLSNLSNISNQTEITNNLKRCLETEEIQGCKKPKSCHNEQENLKKNVLKRLINNRLGEIITYSNSKLKKKNEIKSGDLIKNDQDLNGKINFKIVNQINFKENSNEEDKKEVITQNEESEHDHKNDTINSSRLTNFYQPPPNIPEDVEDYDKKQLGDVEAEAHFAYEIFEYYRKKEKLFIVKNYIDEQPEITKTMRAILVDWIVEVQEYFRLNHETVYLSIKIVDHYLSKVKCPRSMFQLLGSIAILIAAKFDKRICPQIESFLYICDNAYSRKQMLEMEKKVLVAIDFNLGMPISYRFLRRYASCAGISMETLTFARFILEMCLMEYDFIREMDSKMACASLLLVFKIKTELNLSWNKSLEFYTHYKEEDLLNLMYRINNYISSPMKYPLNTIREKYMNRAFFCVAANKFLKVDK